MNDWQVEMTVLMAMVKTQLDNAIANKDYDLADEYQEIYDDATKVWLEKD